MTGTCILCGHAGQLAPTTANRGRCIDTTACRERFEGQLNLLPPGEMRVTREPGAVTIETRGDIMPMVRRGEEILRQRRARAPQKMSDAPPFQPGSKTSRAGADFASRFSRTQQGKIEAFIRDKGPYGATREEIWTQLKMRPGSVQARVRTSYMQGWIGSNPGHERPGTSGIANEVLVWETYVERWAPEQTRPATREKPPAKAIARTSALAMALESIGKSLGGWDGNGFAKVLLHPTEANAILKAVGRPAKKWSLRK
jgi:hypothetical protein